MSIKTKLLLAQIPLALALLFLGAIAITTIGKLGSSSQQILKENYRSVLATQRMKEAIERMDSAALFITLGRYREGEQLASLNRRLFEEELEVQKNNITERGEQQATKILLENWQNYVAAYENFLKEKEGEILKVLFFQDLLPKFFNVKKGADQILAMNQDAMVRKSGEVLKFSKYLETLITLTALIAALVGIITTFILTTRIIRPLSVLTQTARRIQEGDLEVRAKIEGSDEIALLANEFNIMNDSLGRFRKSSLGELLQVQYSSQAAIDSLPDPVVFINLEDMVLNSNRAAEALLGPNLSGHLEDMVRPLTQALSKAIEIACNYVKSGKGAYLPSDLEEAVKVAVSKEEHFLLTQASPVYDETGNLGGISIILRDVTLLSKLDDMGKNLVATLAHEFKTPLTSLHLAIHILIAQLTENMTAKQLDLIYAAREDCERLQNLVDDILNLARLRSGRLELRRIPVRIFPLIEHIIDQYHAMAEENNLTLSHSLPPIDDSIFADPERLEQVFANLITNAVRHTPAGGSIEINASIKEGSVRFEVKDTGEGIPKEYQKKIFDKYFQVSDSQKKGTGLGLSIVKNIVEAHGGEVGLESEPGQGSTFWFSLPKLERQLNGL